MAVVDIIPEGELVEDIVEIAVLEVVEVVFEPKVMQRSLQLFPHWPDLLLYVPRLQQQQRIKKVSFAILTIQNAFTFITINLIITSNRYILSFDNFKIIVILCTS